MGYHIVPVDSEGPFASMHPSQITTTTKTIQTKNNEQEFAANQVKFRFKDWDKLGDTGERGLSKPGSL